MRFFIKYFAKNQRAFTFKTWMKAADDQCLFQISFQVSCVSPFPESSFDGSTWYVCFDKFINLMCGDCGDCSAALICPKICSRAAVIVVIVVEKRQTTEIASLSSQLKLHRNQLTQTHSEICKLVWCLQDPATPFPWSSSCWAGIASKQNRGCPGGTVFTEHGISNPLSMARLELGWTRDKPLFCKLYSDYLHFTGTGTLSSDRL